MSTTAYTETTTTATFRTFDANHTEVRYISAKGFQSQFHAKSYFEQQVGRITLEVGEPVWLSNLVCSNGDLVCQAVPRYWAAGVQEVS